MTWEHDEIETCWIYPMIQRYNDTEILWAIEDGGIYIFEIERNEAWCPILRTSETGLKGIGNGLYFSHIVE